MGSPSGSGITVRPYSAVAAFFGAGLLLAMALLLASGTKAMLRSVRLECDRGAGVCAIVGSWGPVSSRETLPLAGVHALRVDAVLVHGRSHTTTDYDGLLVTDQGDKQISNVSTSDPSERRAARDAFNAFLADPSRRTVDIPYDRPNIFAGLLLAFWATVMLVLASHLTRSSRVWVDHDRRTLHVKRLRLPLRSVETTFPLSALLEVRVATSRSARNGDTFAVELSFEGRPPFLVVDSYTGGRAAKDDAVAKIEALIRSR